VIEKYSADARRGIFIISKYDNFLPFISGHYSLMPHCELPYWLITENEIRRAVYAIREGRPEYVFVDTDIEMYAEGDERSALDPWCKLFNGVTTKRSVHPALVGWLNCATSTKASHVIM
jgi:hypothetical protein